MIERHRPALPFTALPLISLVLLSGCSGQVLDLDRDDRRSEDGSPPADAPLQMLPFDPLWVLHPEHGDLFVPAAEQREAFTANAPQQRVAVVYLAVDGVTLTRAGWSVDNARDNTSPVLQLDEAEVPPFDHTPWGDDRSQVLNVITDQLKSLYAPFEVRFVTERPASGDYTMIVVGGTPDLIGLEHAPAGIAPFDVDDRNPSDVGFVFSERFASAGYPTTGVATFIAHELGHTFGLAHIDRTEDVMFPRACHCDVDFGVGPIIAADGTTTAEEQDDLALLATVLLPRGDGEPICPWDDTHEPDDDDAPVPLAVGEAEDALLCPSDDDYFVLDDAPVGCEVVADVRFRHDEGNLWLKMRRPDGTVGARSFSNRDDERAIEMTTDDGPPVAHVGAGNTVDNDYEVTLWSRCLDEVGCDEGGDLHEPNDGRGAAATRLYPPAATLGAICEDDVDLFRVFARKDCTLRVDLAFVDDDGDLDLKVERYDGTVVRRSMSVSDDEHVSFEVDRTSVYYARVYGFRQAINTYRLDVTTACP